MLEICFLICQIRLFDLKAWSGGRSCGVGIRSKKVQSRRHSRSWVYSWVLWGVLFLQIKHWAILQQQNLHLQWHIQRWKTHSGRLLFRHGCSSKVCASSKLFILLFLKIIRFYPINYFDMGPKINWLIIDIIHQTNRLCRLLRKMFDLRLSD